MLTLTRRIGERIAIGGEIEITVVDVGRGKVRIGIAAPRHLAVHRAEVLERIEEENRRALQHAEARRSMRADHAAVVIDPSTITIDEGLPGLRHLKLWQIVDLPNEPSIRELVAVEDEFIRLLVVDALELDRDYPIARAQKDAGFENEDVAVALVVTLPASGGVPSVNLLAPIVFGLTSRSAKQVILDGTGLPSRCEISVEPIAAAHP